MSKRKQKAIAVSKRRKSVQSPITYSILRRLEKNSFLKKIDYLKQNYANKKKYPKEMEVPLLVALSRYPELKKVHITFKFKPLWMIAVARLKPSFLWCAKPKRQYVIYVNTSKFPFNGPLYEELSFNARVGVFAHELAHIVDYTTKSRVGLIFFGLQYIFKRTRNRIEWLTDLEAINRGFASQIFDFINEATTVAKTSRAYKKRRKKNYLTKQDVRAYIKDVYEVDV